MLSNLSVIFKQKKQKRELRTRKRRSSMSKDPPSHPSTVRSVIGIDQQKKHSRRASAPVQSMASQMESRRENDQGSQGWFQWGLSFLFYDVKSHIALYLLA